MKDVYYSGALVLHLIDSVSCHGNADTVTGAHNPAGSQEGEGREGGRNYLGSGASSSSSTRTFPPLVRETPVRGWDQHHNCNLLQICGVGMMECSGGGMQQRQNKDSQEFDCCYGHWRHLPRKSPGNWWGKGCMDTDCKEKKKGRRDGFETVLQ